MTAAAIVKVREEFEAGPLRPRLARWHADVDATVRGWSDVWLTNDYRLWDIAEFLGDIRAPVLIVQGENDDYGTVRQIEIARQACTSPVEVALLSGIGHSPHHEAADVTLSTVAAFADRLLREPGEGSATRPRVP
jgi:pimeloyl-ACP methyl ester carboxylesterase